MELEKEMMTRYGKHVDFIKLEVKNKCENFEEKLRLFSDGIPNVELFV